MPTLSLFPPEEDRLVPAADRAEPVFWIRRLVIVPSLQADAVPVRDIEFRRGLNIVQASPRLETDTDVVGHSVGKTLLTRLIRYSLGEPGFATKSERTKIIGYLPDACVFDVRPLFIGPTRHLWCDGRREVQTDGLRS